MKRGRRKKNYFIFVRRIFIIGFLLLLGFVIIFFLLPPVIMGIFPRPEVEEIPLRYTVIEAYSSSGLEGSNWVTYGHVKLRNDDTESGIFTVICKFETKEGILTDIVSVYISPGEVKEVTCKADTKFGQRPFFNYLVFPPSKFVTNIALPYPFAIIGVIVLLIFVGVEVFKKFW
jgi:hypothetical protein